MKDEGERASFEDIARSQNGPDPSSPSAPRRRAHGRRARRDVEPERAPGPPLEHEPGVGIAAEGETGLAAEAPTGPLSRVDDEQDATHEQEPDQPGQEDDGPLFGAAESRPRGRRAAEGEPEPVHKVGFFRRVIPLLLVLAVIGGVGYGGYRGYEWVTSNVALSGPEETDFEGTGSSEEVVIVVHEGDTGTDIANTLVEAGVIKSAHPFVQAFSSNPDAAEIEPGSYRMNTEMSSSSALSRLLDPESLAGIRVSIPEGMRMSTIFEKLEKETGIPVEDFEKAAKNYTDYGIPENPADSPEGYLWPGRYDIPEDATAGEVLQMMSDRMQSELEKRGVEPEDQHELLTKASIAEKEARDSDDFGKVIRTIDNRLEGVGEAKGNPMKLQLDSTVAYATDTDTISTTDKQRATDSPYNTYKYEGLPIGPIANPGAETIDAALDPPKGKWLYWVTVNTDTGETKFAETHAEHEKNVKEWQEWAAKKDD